MSVLRTTLTGFAIVGVALLVGGLASWALGQPNPWDDPLGTAASVLGVVGALVVLVPLLVPSISPRWMAGLNRAYASRALPLVLFLIFGMFAVLAPAVLLWAWPVPRQTLVQAGTFAAVAWILSAGGLMYRVAARLERQKEHVRRMLKCVSDLPSDPSYTQVSGMFEELCWHSLRAFATTTLFSSRRRTRLCTLLLADPARSVRRFRLRAHHGCSNLFASHLRSREKSPPMLNLRRFLEAYGRVSSKPLRERVRFDTLEDFRRQLADCSSTAAWVYAANRRLPFENAYKRCVTTSFWFLEGQSKTEVRNHQFRQLVAFPLHVRGRRAGVLLLYSTQRRWMYGADRLDRTIGAIFSLAMELAFRSANLGVEATDATEAFLECDQPWLESLALADVSGFPEAEADIEDVRGVFDTIGHRFPPKINMPSPAYPRVGGPELGVVQGAGPSPEA